MKAPKAPDPAQTASAQGQANVATATAQSLLNQYDMVGPDGSVTYNQTGTNSYVDPLTGKTMTTPKFTQTTALSPEQQKLYDLENQTNQNLGQIGVQQSGKIGELLNTPLNLNNEATEGRLWELGKTRLDPQFEQQQKSMDANLIARGIRPGSEAYNREQTRFSQGKNDAYNQLLLTGRGQATQEALTERNQPINEISALLSNSQVSMPGQVATPQAGVSPTDYTGAVNNNYNAKVNSANAFNSGLFGLASAGLGGWASGSFANPFGKKVA
jgi:hypothetical protein